MNKNIIESLQGWIYGKLKSRDHKIYIKTTDTSKFGILPLICNDLLSKGDELRAFVYVPLDNFVETLVSTYKKIVRNMDYIIDPDLLQSIELKELLARFNHRIEPDGSVSFDLKLHLDYSTKGPHYIWSQWRPFPFIFDDKRCVYKETTHCDVDMLQKRFHAAVRRLYLLFDTLSGILQESMVDDMCRDAMRFLDIVADEVVTVSRKHAESHDTTPLVMDVLDKMFISSRLYRAVMREIVSPEDIYISILDIKAARQNLVDWYVSCTLWAAEDGNDDIEFARNELISFMTEDLRINCRFLLQSRNYTSNQHQFVLKNVKSLLQKITDEHNIPIDSNLYATIQSLMVSRPSFTPPLSKKRAYPDDDLQSLASYSI